jgi:hypothetical protein
MKDKGAEYELPMHCAFCGAQLMGGATVHKEDCEIRKLIEETFGKPNELRS